MPLKYKKLVILFSLGIMMIGLGTFSLLSPEYSAHTRNAQEHADLEFDADTATFGAIEPANGKTSEQIQTELEELMSRYFTAKQKVDMDTIAQCVSDIRHIDEKKLLAEAQYVEAYEDLQCLVMNGATKDTYRVYVRYNVKIVGIETLMPSLNALYVKRTDKGAFQIYLGNFKEEEQKHIEKLDGSLRVQQLVNSVQNALEDVVSTDADVRDFYNMLENAK